jgi:hypothetical protein
VESFARAEDVSEGSQGGGSGRRRLDARFHETLRFDGDMRTHFGIEVLVRSASSGPGPSHGPSVHRFR